MSTQNDRISELAKEDPKRQFYSIGHMITPEALYAAFRGLRKKASAGVDGVTYEEYERDVARNIQTLHERLKNGKYQAQPLRRVYIPKENVHRARENDEEAVPTGPDGNRRMVPGEPTHACG
jgi:retron-type reverse transcriptase